VKVILVFFYMNYVMCNIVMALHVMTFPSALALNCSVFHYSQECQTCPEWEACLEWVVVVVPEWVA